MIRTWTLIPLAVFAVCAAWVWILNRRPRLRGMVWPKGVDLGGSRARPDLSYAADVVLGCDARFGTIQCRTLVIAAGAEITADVVVASRVRVEGRLSVRNGLTAGVRLEVRGDLRAEEVKARRIVLRAGSRTTAITVLGNPRIRRHPQAQVKGFFEHRDEIELDRTRLSAVVASSTSTTDDTDPVTLARGGAG